MAEKNRSRFVELAPTPVQGTLLSNHINQSLPKSRNGVKKKKTKTEDDKQKREEEYLSEVKAIVDFLSTEGKLDDDKIKNILVGRVAYVGLAEEYTVKPESAPDVDKDAAKRIQNTWDLLKLTYEIRKGRNGQYTKELWIDRRENSKSLAWSSVLLALNNIKEVGAVVDRPKTLGDIRGATYIYGMFYRFGLLDMPDKVNGKMKRAGRQM